ncbi:DUF4129 domain-containing protein [Luteimicrobium subarcticum]|uniref:Uncharacterized protein DUF4129 n=1 Tax=Luteimicrobium subarcticum TaxID=620910 RepID=A0A2M8WTS1_9MICO|nr:DUF4129 domain-containing protein [Luteimicrobium subarcticum]PJI94284.1 uncharacterized protein DUF4129 [Luteimicrobium subarcticum]
MALSLVGATAGVLADVLADVPVTPDAPTAQRWLRDELSHSEYHEHTSILQRILRWLADLFDAQAHPHLPTGLLALVGVAIALVLVAVVVRYAGPTRRTARATTAKAVLVDDARTATQIRAAADDAGRRGDWPLAVVERFRAVVRSLEERAVLDEVAGRTADEAAHAAAALLPDQADGLARGARLFDDVLYGDRVATADDHATLLALDRAVTAARPRRTSPAPAAVAP